jgi:hypothetical protein
MTQEKLDSWYVDRFPKQEKEAYFCNICLDTGEVDCMDYVYPNEPHMANVGTRMCVCRLEEDYNVED